MNKFEKVVRYVISLIKEEKLKPSDKLPSIRAMAKDFSCNKSTIIRAYQELEDKHYIYSVNKSGYYVVESMEREEDNLEVFDFLSASPDLNAMPYKDFQHCINQAIDIYKNEIFSYSPFEGIYSLRCEIQKYLQDFQVFADADNLFITTGAQQAINLAVNMPFPNKRNNILIEQPTYYGALESIKNTNYNIYGIDVSKNSIDLEKLEHILKNHDIKLFYVMTRFQNPSGFSYSNEDKKRILALIQKYDVYLVEDDFLSELDLDTKADPFYSFDDTNRVIYIKSFSKVFLPGMRIASIVVPDRMKSEFIKYKFTSDFNSPAISQGAFEIYLKSGMFHTHIEKIKKLYKNKLDILLEACKTYFDDSIKYSKPNNGFFICIYLPDNIKATYITNILKEKSVHVKDCSNMYLDDFNRDNAIRICISKIEENKIEKGIEIISKVIKQNRKRLNRITDNIMIP
ncbi:PLP-dependent aminotransferase family protein [Oceanobacillus sp. FSL W8-0428]|uniref:aminotransferase-like domain-containing protein n=1 Tax=Oceanobacillus sp. FSL W8-0428 TaxID=2921715 RepID=UPI0030F6BE76